MDGLTGESGGAAEPAASGQSPAADEAARPLLSALERYLRHLRLERGLSENTVTSYRRDLRRYALYLTARGVTAFEQASRDDVRAFAASLRDPEQGPPLAERSAARIVVAVRGLHKHLVAEGLAEENPAARVKPPEPPKRLPKALTVGEVERLLAVPRLDTPLGLRDRALLEFLYGTGARISEAVGLAVDDVVTLDEAADSPGDSAAAGDDDGSGLPAVPELVRLTGKGDKQRIVPLGSYAQKALQEYRVRARPLLAAKAKSSNGGALFLNARGGRLSRQSAWSIIQDAAEKAEIAQEVSPHTLRHSFATHLVEGGADIRAVQELMGHASISSTQIYTKVTVDTLREVYAVSHPRAR
ncbi:site-specific tyrosine recombinase XerD [Arthrobacter sp. UM1]|uniref:site-specific tyrosine recombinase XerD n=1 Tax=Arthrobacter sp. UM1 TaxID=2766776 RepID=UPI001CF694B5|nr:site-specific tyrosine recombinase XerD [Arthrobacter sp. UM1]MCB4207185.1 site-specific tyrosine recombinase XerD [Arthrobacter sp. UM1]